MLIMLNCHNRCHSQLYGRFDVFFDLAIDGHENEKRLLYEGATCCVLSYADIRNKSGNVVLSYWQYRNQFQDRGENTCVLNGVKIGEIVVAKTDLVHLAEFEGVVARDGDFNRFSVLQSSK